VELLFSAEVGQKMADMLVFQELMTIKATLQALQANQAQIEEKQYMLLEKGIQDPLMSVFKMMRVLMKRIPYRPDDPNDRAPSSHDDRSKRMPTLSELRDGFKKSEPTTSTPTPSLSFLQQQTQQLQQQLQQQQQLYALQQQHMMPPPQMSPPQILSQQPRPMIAGRPTPSKDEPTTRKRYIRNPSTNSVLENVAPSSDDDDEEDERRKTDETEAKKKKMVRVQLGKPKQSETPTTTTTLPTTTTSLQDDLNEEDRLFKS
jgi:hypothetical protein